jgi:hypothetical protein
LGAFQREEMTCGKHNKTWTHLWNIYGNYSNKYRCKKYHTDHNSSSFNVLKCKICS